MAEHPLEYGTVLQSKSYRYTIKKVLGQGSFGIAYLATMYYQTKIDDNIVECHKDVALKEFFMRNINGRNGSSVTDCSNGNLFSEYKLKFEREAKNLRFMVHPHVIQVYDYFEANGTAYYSMEYLPNGSLDDKIERLGILSEKDALRHIKEIGLALSYMHDYKMLHLDLKPSNILINDDDEAVLIDFGLSKQYDNSGKPETSTSVGKGTPGYAPIEQANYQEGKEFPVTMDVYALGATLFKMLTGKRPPEASEILNDGFPAYELQAIGINGDLISIVAKALNPRKNDRYQTIEEFISFCQPVYDKEKADALELQGYDEYEKGNTDVALVLFKECFAEDSERADIAYQIAEMYEDGKGTEINVVTATSWYLRAAKLGHSKAAADVGEIYSQGDYVPQNTTIALKWLRIAANDGLERAQVALADMYYNGDGCPKDYIEAARWYQSVIDINPEHSRAIYSLGRMYELGEGVSRDYIKASQLYKMVADSNANGDVSMPLLGAAVREPDCMFRLGYLYQHGLGVDIDYNKAIHYYNKAIKYNYASAYFNLGCMYNEGIGVHRDSNIAFSLWIKASNADSVFEGEVSSGQVSALYNLGVCHEIGNGCVIDYDLAMEWYLKAFNYNHPKAPKAIESLKLKMANNSKGGRFLNKIRKLFF